MFTYNLMLWLLFLQVLLNPTSTVEYMSIHLLVDPSTVYCLVFEMLDISLYDYWNSALQSASLLELSVITQVSM